MPIGNSTDAGYAALNQDLKSAPVTRTLSTTTATSSVLALGRHRIVSTVDCYVRQGASTVVSTTSMSYLPAGVIDYIFVSSATTDGYVAGITALGTGTLFITAQ